MAPDGTRNSSSSVVRTRNALKKGPWTTSEDMILVEYVKKHGEGNWNAVQRNSGLMRCGKSCRLRWANHLRPNLKKGAFSAEEEKLIIELHSKLGNKWARMAAQLPGRTDNEIKNYWNTRLKRRQRAGLPVYPQEILQEERKQLNSSLLASSSPNNPLYFYDNFSSSSMRSPQNLQPNPYTNNQLKLFRGENNSLALSSSNLSEAPYFNPLPMPWQIQYDSIEYGIETGPEMGVLGLPSIQSPLTPAASSSDFVMTTTSSDCAEDYEGFSRCNNSGLLEDLLGKSQAMGCIGKTEDSFVAADANVQEKAAFGLGKSDDNYEDRELEGNTSMDDDLMNLLNNFPLSVPIPDWDEGHEHESPILTNGTNGTIESQPDVSEYNPVAASTGAANQDWQFGSCLWNNMPSIY